MNRHKRQVGRWMMLVTMVWVGCATVRAFAAVDPAAAPATSLQSTALISMDYQNANLQNVLKVLSQQAGLNFIATQDVQNLPITLYLERVPVEAAVQQLMRAYQLTYEFDPQSRIFVVRPAPKTAEAPAEDPLETRVYQLRYARVGGLALEAVSAAFASQTPFEASGGPSLGTTSGGASGGAVAGGGVELIIRNLVTARGKVTTDPRTNRLIVTDVANNLARIEHTLRELDMPSKQVIIEAEVLETSATLLKELGVELGSSSGQLAVLTPSSRTTSFPFSLNDQIGERFNRLASTAAAQGVTTGTLSFTDAKMVLKAIETDSRTKILARPRLMMLDHESAMIKLAEDAVLAITTTTSGTTGTVTQEIERSPIPTGVVLSVTPQINEDRFVTLLLQPSVSRLVNSGLVANAQKVLNPRVRTVRTMVRIADGETIMIGGLLDSTQTETVRKLPILGDVPLLGLMFRKQDKDESSTEIIVFLTPHIVREPVETAGAFEGDGGREQAAWSALPRESTIEQALNRLEGL